MEKTPLSVLVSKLGQKKVADLFGIQQSAINKALKNKRNIFVIHVDGIVVGAEEIKVFPNKPERVIHASNQCTDA